MNNFLMVLLAAFAIQTATAQKRDSVVIENDIYKIVYSEVLEQPMYIKYTVLCPEGTASRSGMDFYTEKTIHTSDGKDYEKNVWDKGHCAPAADFNCTKEMLYKTFSYVNCVLQHEKLNRGAWRLLEAHEREIAKTKNTIVEIQVVFSDKSVKLPTGATIPDGFYKMIYANGNLIECYYFDNAIPSESDYNRYKISCKNN
jgi:endonuclease G